MSNKVIGGTSIITTFGGNIIWCRQQEELINALQQAKENRLMMAEDSSILCTSINDVYIEMDLFVSNTVCTFMINEVELDLFALYFLPMW